MGTPTGRGNCSCTETTIVLHDQASFSLSPLVFSSSTFMFATASLIGAVAFGQFFGLGAVVKALFRIVMFVGKIVWKLCAGVVRKARNERREAMERETFCNANDYCAEEEDDWDEAGYIERLNPNNPRKADPDRTTARNPSQQMVKPKESIAQMKKRVALEAKLEANRKAARANTTGTSNRQSPKRKESMTEMRRRVALEMKEAANRKYNRE